MTCVSTFLVYGRHWYCLLLMQLNVYLLTCCGDVCVSFGYAVCRCYERSVELVLFYIGGLGCVCCFLVFNFLMFQISGYIYISIYVSFMCTLFLLILYMWYFSDVFKRLPFFSVFMMSNVCYSPVFNIWFEYPEFPPVTTVYKSTTIPPSILMHLLIAK
jgi:hypothetical protein